MVRNAVVTDMRHEKAKRISGAGSKKIVIATPDILGPVSNGGIGTAYGHLAELLSLDGHSVTILFTAHGLGSESEQEWKDYYKERNIDFIAIKSSSPASVSGLFGDALSIMRDTYESLIDLGEIDIIHAPDWRGHIYYALLAKHLGLEFSNTIFCVTAHAPSLWALNGNLETISTKKQLITIAAEKHLYKLADIVISPSSYMFEWLDSKKISTTDNRLILPNLMRSGLSNITKRTSSGIKELVFFGRLEKRKGLDVFVGAIDRLHKQGAGKNLLITFMGKETAYGVDLLDRATSNWSNKINVITDYDSAQALDYLSESDERLAVIPSLCDNSPYTVLECLSLQIPFVAADVGGVRELIREDCADKVLFKPFSRFLATRLEEVLDCGYDHASLAFDLEELRCKWSELHTEDFFLPSPDSASPSSQPLVSVCIPHHDRPEYLAQALESIDRQTYSNIEVVVVDDGSKKRETHDFFESKSDYFGQDNRRLIRQDNLHVSVARNTAVRHARGKYIVFMDDDNCAKPDTVETFVHCAQHSGADILTCFYDGFSKDTYPFENDVICRYTPFGKDASLGLLENCFGDANCFFTKEAFERLGGFTEIYGVGREDHDIFARAALMDLELFVVPKSLFYYRTGKGGMSQVNRVRIEGPMRVLDSYCKNAPPELAGILEYAFSAGVHGVHNDTLVYRIAEGLRLKIAAFPLGERILLKLRGIIMKFLK